RSHHHPSALPHLSTAAERVDVDRQHLERRIVEALTPRRHAAVPREEDRVIDRIAVAAVQPDAVGEVGRTHFLIALAVGLVARNALLGEDLGAFGIGFAMAGEAQYVVCDRADLGRSQESVDAEAGYQ